MAYTTIDDPSAHFQTAIYTGTGSSRSVTNDGNSNLQPDLIWIKERDGTGSHAAFDSTRGVQKELKLDVAEAEATAAQSVTAFDSDGFTVGTAGDYNGSNNLQVAWQWKANGGTRTTFNESGNNPGGGYQVNTTAGFSIVDWTGTGGAGTISHGLGAAPQVIIVHDRGGNNHATFWHTLATDPWTDYVRFDTDLVVTDDAGRWNDTAPGSSTFTVGNNNEVNGDDRTYVAWCFREIQGYSCIGTYRGGGTTDGTFVHTGFKPAMIILTKISGTANWQIRDIKRDPFNDNTDQIIFPDLNDIEAASGNNIVDFLSNGFHMSGTGGDHNETDADFIFIAFAHRPFVTSDGIPCTAQ